MRTDAVPLRGELSHIKSAENLALGSSPPIPRRVSRPTAAPGSSPFPRQHPACPCSITSSRSLQAPSILVAGESRACPVPQFPLLCSEDRQMQGEWHEVSGPRPRAESLWLFLPLTSGKWLCQEAVIVTRFNVTESFPDLQSPRAGKAPADEGSVWLHTLALFWVFVLYLQINSVEVKA